MIRKTTEQFIKDAKKVHGNRYDYSLVEYISAHKKVKIKCKKHDFFEQTPHHHLNGSGCKKCHYINQSNNQKLNINNFINKSNLIHDDKYDYSLVNYINNSTKIKIICKKCNTVFEQIPQDHLKGCGCANCKNVKKL